MHPLGISQVALMYDTETRKNADKNENAIFFNKNRENGIDRQIR